MIFETIPSGLRALLFLCRCDFGVRRRLSGERRSNRRIKVPIWRPIYGWVILRVRIRSGRTNNQTLRMYFVTPKGRHRHRILDLHPLEGDQYESIIFSEAFISNFYLHVSGGANCDIQSCELYNVPRQFVRKIALDNLAQHHPTFRNFAVDSIRSHLVTKGRETKKCFDAVLEACIYDLLTPRFQFNYQGWIRLTEQGSHTRNTCRQTGVQCASSYSPLISILVPVYNTPKSFLRECLQSVLDQDYSNWQLCVADDGSSLPHVREIIEEFRNRDKRVQVTYRKVRGHISLATNTALAMARGEYVATLDHDDMLAPFALSALIEALQNEPRAKFLYSDEDKIDKSGKRFDPHFKGGWNPDFLYSQNYICHFTLCETKLIQSVGGFREGFEGSQDYDLFLRVTDKLSSEQIVHIPRVLYHWRSFGNSTARAPTSKPYAWEAGERALTSFFKDKGEDVSVERGPLPFTYRTYWSVQKPEPLVSIVIPTKDRSELLKACVSSLFDFTNYPNFELLIVDNESKDEATLSYLYKLSENCKVRILNFNGNFNFSAINNFAVSQARGDLICLLNNDTEAIEGDWLSEMASHALRSEIGCVGAKLLYPDRRIQHAGVICGLGGVAGHSHKYFPKDAPGYFGRLLLTQNVSAVTAACMVVRHEIWDSVGGMDEFNLPVAFNDVDLCLRIQSLGLRNLWTPHAVLIHHESASRGRLNDNSEKERAQREIRFMQEKWRDYLAGDPYYSPHLSLARTDWSIALPMGQQN